MQSAPSIHWHIDVSVGHAAKKALNVGCGRAMVDTLDTSHSATNVGSDFSMASDCTMAV